MCWLRLCFQLEAIQVDSKSISHVPSQVVSDLMYVSMGIL